MGLEKRTIKIIVIVSVVVLIIGGSIGLLLGLLLRQHYVELEVWPRSEEYNYNQPLIRFDPSNADSWHPWYQRIDDFLKIYETSIPEETPRAPCTTHNQGDQQVRSDACDMAMKTWAPCTADHFYGYREGGPCVFLRLSYMDDWVPEPYNSTVDLPTPPEMPQYLQQFMRHYPASYYGDFAWVSCDGQFASDQDNIGPIQYIPGDMPPGFPISRLFTTGRIPYSARNLRDQSPGPLIAVLFERPRREVEINVECRIWTRDIYNDRSSRVGRARFQIYVG